jgi:hypothetical protein
MSIFRYEAAAQQPHFYSAAVCPAGADRVDELVLADLIKRKALGTEPQSEWLGRIRVAKQDDEDGRRARRHMDQVLPAEVYERASIDFGRELFAQYKQVLWKGYEQEKIIHRWQDLAMFLIGGGSRLCGLEGILANSPWPGHLPGSRIVRLELPSGIACNGDDPTGDCVKRHEQLLMVAFGLSFPYAALADYTMPDNIEALELPQIGSRPIPIEDMEKWGHWW